MYISQAEENRNRAIASIVSLLILGLLLLFLILFKLITPNPPFPESADGGGGIQVNFGTYNEGTGNVEQNGIGNATSVVENKETTPPPAEAKNAKEETYTSENGETIEPTDNKPKTKNNVTVITPVKPKEAEKPIEKTEAEKLAEKFNKNKGRNGGGDGNSGHAGNEGSPDGNPNTNGTGGSGGGTGGGNGPGDGPGEGPGSGGFNGRFGFNLKGAAVLQPPSLPKDTKEEGKVVVEITVDKAGNVIDANPNGRGTTTSSAVLKAKARQAALATKFKVSGQFEEQTGTITIVFSFN
ncbi:MAG: energy transducer TonB family protein [Bacteroidia bacterium]